ncbi:MAG: hypothetical protein ABL996_16760 [Micropepsaceae bacterium]
MKLESAGAVALISGTLAMILVMAHHPSGVPHGPDAVGVMRLGLIVHAVAIATVPLMTFGFFALTRSIGFANPIATLAFFFYLFGAVAVMLAATMSGLVAPRLIEAQMAATAADQSMIHALLRLEWYLNQSFAQIHVALFSGAIALWALAWPDKGILAAAIQIAGLTIGIGVFAWLVSGMLSLDVHGMGAVVLAQSVWMIIAAFGLLARR